VKPETIVLQQLKAREIEFRAFQWTGRHEDAAHINALVLIGKLPGWSDTANYRLVGDVLIIERHRQSSAALPGDWVVFDDTGIINVYTQRHFNRIFGDNSNG